MRLRRQPKNIVVPVGANSDDDVEAERKYVDALNKEEILSSENTVILKHLRKEYMNAKTKQMTPVVKDTCLHIPKGECFGMLGPNGAGKVNIFAN